MAIKDGVKLLLKFFLSCVGVIFIAGLSIVLFVTLLDVQHKRDEVIEKQELVFQNEETLTKEDAIAACKAMGLDVTKGNFIEGVCGYEPNLDAIYEYVVLEFEDNSLLEQINWESFDIPFRWYAAKLQTETKKIEQGYYFYNDYSWQKEESTYCVVKALYDEESKRLYVEYSNVVDETDVSPCALLYHSYRTGNWEKAPKYLDRAKEHECWDENSSLFQAIAIEVLTMDKQYDEAIRLANEGVEKFPNEDYHFYRLIGTIYQFSGDTEQAIYYLKKTLEIRPTYARPFIQLGYIYEEIGEKENAVDNYVSALLLFDGNNAIEECKEYANIILKLDSMNITALTSLQRIYELEGNKEKVNEIQRKMDSLMMP